MIVPFAVPIDGELVNVSQIVRYVIHQPGKCFECADAELSSKPIIHIVGKPTACTVYFSDGSTRIYKDNAFAFLNHEIGWLLQNYRQLQSEMSSNIITPESDRRII